MATSTHSCESQKESLGYIFTNKKQTDISEEILKSKGERINKYSTSFEQAYKHLQCSVCQ